MSAFTLTTGVVGSLRGLGRAMAACMFALVTVLVVAACGSKAAPVDAAPGDPSLAAIRSDIFNASCTQSSCHGSASPAAKLDLLDNGVCRALVAHTSCLFPSKFLVLPGKPEASFLMDKLRGTALDGAPDPSCATTNDRMPPPGQPPLSDAQIAQVEAWIKAGANCGGDVGPDAGVDAGTALADVASISAGTTTLVVGGTTQVTVTLTHGAPPNGQLVIIDIDDPAILGDPGSFPVAEGMSTVMFTATGKAPGIATITASSGPTAQTLTFTVM